MIDTHSHYDHKKFNKDRILTIDNCREYGIQAFINCAISYQSNYRMITFFEHFPDVFFTVGVHPNRVGDLNILQWNQIKSLMRNPDKVVAIGETGLDYHYKNDNHTKELQKYYFEKHIELAEQFELPLVLHFREAYEDGYRILKSNAVRKGVVHSFQGDYEMANRFIGLGLYLGIGTPILYTENNQLREAIKMVPVDKIVLESDSPFLSINEEKRNTSLCLSYVVKELSGLTGVSEQKIVEITTRNAKALFGI